MVSHSASLMALAGVNLAFYAVALLPTIYCAWRLPFARSMYGHFVGILVLMRVVGEPMTLATGGTLDLTNGVSIAGYTLGNIGLSLLLLASGAGVQAFNKSLGATNSAIPPQIVRLWGVVPLVALVLGIVGNVDMGSSDPDTQQTGSNLRQGATALYVVTWALLALMLVRTVPLASRGERGPRLLMYAAAATVPFLAVRTVYQCLGAFGNPTQQRAHAANVLEKALMGSLMEWICVFLLLLAGVYVARRVPMEHPAPVRGETATIMEEEEEGRGSQRGRAYVQKPYDRRTDGQEMGRTGY